MNYRNGHEFEFTYLRPSQIRCDMLYQRKLEQRRAEKIAKEFNGDTFNEPKVSYRDGVYWVFDGQHSIAAWKILHDNADKPVYCKVFKGMTWLEEAEAFVTQNGIKKDPTTTDKLRAAYNAHDPNARAMVEGAELCGYTVNFSDTHNKTANRVLAVSALFRSLMTLGYAKYVDMLTAIKEAWYGDPDAVCQQIISAMTAFYKTYDGNFKHEDLVNAMRRVAPIAIIRNAKNYDNRRNAYTREIVKTYNKRKKQSRLDEGLLA